MIIEQREFIQHTPKYLAYAQSEEVFITVKGKPILTLHASLPIKRASQLAGTVRVVIKEDDINSHVLDPLE